MTDFDLRAMEPLPWPKPFDDPDFVFQVKWDGVRMLSLCQHSEVRLFNRRGAERTLQYPELAHLGTMWPTGTVLDGELVVLQAGKPSFNRILRRDLARQPAVIQRGCRQNPVIYALFDLLYWQSKDVRRWPWHQRQQLLASVASKQDPALHMVESFPSGCRLFAAVQEQKLEGIVAKRRDSSYIPGKKSSDWRKIKSWRQLTCAVGGYTLRQGQPSALLLGLFDATGLMYVGRAGSGLSQQDWRALSAHFAATAASQPGFVNPPVGSKSKIQWVTLA